VRWIVRNNAFASWLLRPIVPEKSRNNSAGGPIACSRSCRYQFAARIVDDHVLCLVDDRPRAAVEDLLKTVRHAGG